MRPLWRAWWVACTASACIETDSSQPTLVVMVEQDAVVAGQAVGWSARLVDGSTQSEAVVVQFESELEPGLAYSGRELFPRVAGAHAHGRRDGATAHRRRGCW